MISVTYSSVDGYRKTRRYKSLFGAQKFAQKMVGERPDVSATFGYAVSDDGVGKITVRGASIFDLFPAAMREYEIADEVCREVEES